MDTFCLYFILWRVSFFHSHLSSTWELFIMSHQSSGTVDMEIEELLWPLQFQPWSWPAEGELTFSYNITEILLLNVDVLNHGLLWDGVFS